MVMMIIVVFECFQDGGGAAAQSRDAQTGRSTWVRLIQSILFTII